MNQQAFNSGNSHITNWQHPPMNFSLNFNEVHVWRASLDLPDAQIDNLKSTLCSEEIKRSEKYHFRKDQKHFIAARGILRNILARYMETKPEKIVLSYSPHGKPFLSGPSMNKELSFNLAHARDFALYAVTFKRRVGVDLEYPRQEFQWEEIVERFFSSREQDALWALPEKDRCRAFYTYWTRKEAFLKAKGVGLTTDLKKVNVALKPERSVYLLKSDYASEKADCWVLHDLHPGFGYVGALAVEGEIICVKYRQWC